MRGVNADSSKPMNIRIFVGLEKSTFVTFRIFVSALDLNNTISPEILSSKVSLGPIEYKQISFSDILFLNKSWYAELYYLVNYSVATLLKTYIFTRLHQLCELNHLDS